MLRDAILSAPGRINLYARTIQKKSVLGRINLPVLVEKAQVRRDQRLDAGQHEGCEGVGGGDGDVHHRAVLGDVEAQPAEDAGLALGGARLAREDLAQDVEVEAVPELLDQLLPRGVARVGG